MANKEKTLKNKIGTLHYSVPNVIPLGFKPRTFRTGI